MRRTLSSELVKLTFLAMVVGVAVAFLTQGFTELIGLLYRSLFGTDNLFRLHQGEEFDFQWWMVALPAVGGLAGGLIIHFGAKEARGHGVPVVLESMTRRGRLSPRLAATKGLAAITCVGSGLSLGRVGPMVLIGSTVGSAISQKLHLTVEHTKVLLGCGAASAIAVAFNAPLGGIVFALELIVTEFKTRSFIPLVVAAVFATSIGQGFEGSSEPVFSFRDEEGVSIVPVTLFDDPWDHLELINFLILGLLAGIGAVAFIKLLYRVDWVSKQLARGHLPAWAHPAVGGLVVGIMAFAGSPLILSNGFFAITAAIQGKVVWQLMFYLVLAKVIATSVSIGSGASGGVFTPSLFIGAMLGGGLAGYFDSLNLLTNAPVAVYIIVGMAAFSAATTRATLTAIVLFFEMAGQVSLVLPLMLACVAADGVSYRFSKETIYTQKLADRGVLVRRDLELNLMAAIKVREAMTRRVMTLPPTAPVNLAMQMMEETGHMAFPIVEEGRLTGIVTQSDIQEILVDKGSPAGESAVGEIASMDLICVNPTDTLDKALNCLARREIGHLPVVDPADATRLVGFLTKGDIVTAYNHQLLLEQRQHEGPVGGI